MPVKQHWLPSGILHISYYGKVTSKELGESTLGLSGDARFDNLKIIISDWTDPENESLEFEEEQIRQLGAYMMPLALSNPRVKLAGILNPNNKNRWEMVNFFETLIEALPWEIKVFDSGAQAKIWLGVDVPIGM